MNNQAPVIMVHGILGFGPKELGPISYWGTAFQVPLFPGSKPLWAPSAQSLTVPANWPRRSKALRSTMERIMPGRRGMRVSGTISPVRGLCLIGAQLDPCTWSATASALPPSAACKTYLKKTIGGGAVTTVGSIRSARFQASRMGARSPTFLARTKKRD